MGEGNVGIPAPSTEDLEITGKGPSVKDQMIALADDRFVLGRNKANNSLFGVDQYSGNIALGFDGPEGVMSQLGLLVYEKSGKTPSNNANSEVKKLLQARASKQGAIALPIRTGRDSIGITIDMGDNAGRAIEVRPEGWEIVDRSQVTFTRTNCTSPLVTPKRAAKGASGMRRLFNVSDAEWDFLVNWQALTFVPDMPHVIPILEGDPGSAKTSTTRMLVGLVDPSKGALNSPPKDQEALEIAAAGSWVFALENISNVTSQISDALARLITGTADRKRELYSDGNIHIREMQRVVVINGISITGLRPDVLDRSVTIRLLPPTSAKRMLDDEVTRAFNAAAPGHLALLLDTLSGAMRLEAAASGKLTEKGRMASFEQWLAYCDAVRGTRSLDWYRAQRKEDIINHSLEDVLASGLAELAAFSKGIVAGTSSEIRADLLKHFEGRLADSKQIPGSAKGMTARLRMLRRGLEEAGWTVEERVYAGSKNAARWEIRPPVG